MKTRFLILASAFAVLPAVSALPAAAQGDLDCWQFGSWQEAQSTYEATLANDGWDWMRLDDDYDGIACECLYYGYECWRPY